MSPLNSVYDFLQWMAYHRVMNSQARTNCFACLCLQILCMHGGLSPELKNLEQIKRIPRPTDVPDTGLLCDLLWADPDKEIQGWGDNDRGVSYTFGPQCVGEFLNKHDLDLVCRAHQVRRAVPHFRPLCSYHSSCRDLPSLDWTPN